MRVRAVLKLPTTFFFFFKRDFKVAQVGLPISSSACVGILGVYATLGFELFSDH